MAATVILKNRHSLQGLNLNNLIKNIRDGKLLPVEEMASFQEGKSLADLSIQELTTAFSDNLLSEETLEDVLKKSGRPVNLYNCRLAIHEAICFANEFGQPNGLYINSLTSSGENIVHLLAKFFHMDYLYIDFSFLFDYELDFNLINNDGNSPLMVASLLNNFQFVATLACDVNRQNNQGHTALHLSVIGFTLIKEKLNMMNVNSVVKELCSREYYPRYLACIDSLLNLGADVNIQDKGGKTVLMLACMKNDRKLLETLLIHGADVNIVDNHGRSALQYIDLTNNVYDLTCFNLLLSHGCKQSLNQPCLNGNTIIQNVLRFPSLWQIDQTVHFIKFLVNKNVNLQLLTSADGEISYGQLSLEEFSSQSRHELRQILYLSGGSFKQITQILHFEVEESKASLSETLREKPSEKFIHFANNLNLKEICRRVIRQNTSRAIHDLISELNSMVGKPLTRFILFKDKDSKRFSLPDQFESFNDIRYWFQDLIDDDYGDAYDFYDLNKENDDYENDYLVFNDYKYLNEVSAGLKYYYSDSDSDSDYVDLGSYLDAD
ncbi:hypothetical protein LOTGIDRAFT_172351 [Lottia gigantea]|uniref:Uncharacterized protein n=1 Tax=Lottia gigantea TaxID=225164 RepID=V4B6S8_LOTGI|nr:hypothetical protein LOTGIDRAFT_172351 [Lottia gigantea]ESP01797.1 hypothetical protein LOTGIDRAFT_172351 [Lottia gigantea]